MSFVRHKSYLNIKMLLRVIGWLLMIESAFMLVPSVVSIIYEIGRAHV